MHGSDSQGSTLHVQVKSWSGVRKGGNGCHYWHYAARATVLAVCCVSVSAVPAVPAVIMAATSIAQRPNIHLQAFINSNPSSTSNHHPRPQLHHIISRHEDIHFPATYWALAACLARAQPLLLQKRGWLGMPSSDWKWEDGTGGNVWAP